MRCRMNAEQQVLTLCNTEMVFKTDTILLFVQQLIICIFFTLYSQQWGNRKGCIQFFHFLNTFSDHKQYTIKVSWL